MMRIAIIAPGTLPVPAKNGGAVESLIDAFIMQEKKHNNGNLIDVFSVSETLSKPMIKAKDSIRFVQFPRIQHTMTTAFRIHKRFKPQLEYKEYLDSVCEWIEKNEYDAVIIENRPTFIYDIAKHTKARIYLHLHNENFMLAKRYCKNVAKYCSHIIVVSNYIKKVVEKNMTSRQNTVVLHNGIDTSLFHKELNEIEKNRIRSRYGLSEVDFVVCFTGRFCWEKGVLEAVQAFRKLNDLDNVVLLIIGSSWFGSNEKNEYIKKVEDASRKCNNKILFTGYVDNKEVAKIESVCDIALLPSLWNDPLPLTIIEAMASSLPVITTNSGGIPEMCTPDSGFILNREDENLSNNISEAIRILYENKELLSLMGQRGRERVVRYFTIDQYYMNFLKIISEG